MHILRVVIRDKRIFWQGRKMHILKVVITLSCLQNRGGWIGIGLDNDVHIFLRNRKQDGDANKSVCSRKIKKITTLQHF